MPLYEYENTKTGERFTENLPINKRNIPLRNPFIRRVLTIPNLSLISDVGGKEDKAREQISQSSEQGFIQREIDEKKGKIKVPDLSKEKRERNKQKRKWL